MKIIQDCDNESAANAVPSLVKINEIESSEESSSTITTLTNSSSNSSTSPETIDSIEIPVFIKSNENRDISNVVTSPDKDLIKKSPNDCFHNIVNCLPIAAESEILVRQWTFNALNWTLIYSQDFLLSLSLLRICFLSIFTLHTSVYVGNTRNTYSIRLTWSTFNIFFSWLLINYI